MAPNKMLISHISCFQIHDGDNSGAKLLGKFCGSATSRIVASGDVIFMRFVTDEADAFRGFNATFKSKRIMIQFGKTKIA